MKNLDPHFDRLQELAPDGFNFGFHIRFSRPAMVKITYRPEWSQFYSAHSFVLMDPSIIWAFKNDGYKRWSQIDIPDELGVFPAARDFGYSYGAAFGLGSPDSRTLGSCGRNDGEFTSNEMEDIYSILSSIHESMSEAYELKPHQQEALELYGKGLTYDQICEKIGISRTALKGRLNGARRVLGAKNNHEAHQLALEQGRIASPHYTGIVKGLPSG